MLALWQNSGSGATLKTFVINVGQGEKGAPRIRIPEIASRMEEHPVLCRGLGSAMYQ